MDQNGRPLEIEEKISLTLPINKQKWHVILQNQEQKNMIWIWIGYGFLLFARNLSNKYGKKIQDTATAGIDATKTASKKVVHKKAQTTGKLIGNKIAK